MIQRNVYVRLFAVCKAVEFFFVRLGQHTEPAELLIGASDDGLGAFGNGGSDRQRELFTVKRRVILHIHRDIAAVAILNMNRKAELRQRIGDHGFRDGLAFQRFYAVNAQLAGVIDF